MRLTEREIVAAHELGEAILRFVVAVQRGSRQRKKKLTIERGTVGRAKPSSSIHKQSSTKERTETPPIPETPPKPPRLVSEQSLLTVAEAAEILSLSRSKVYGLMETGKIPYIKLGKSRRLRLSDVRQVIIESEVSRY